MSKRLILICAAFLLVVIAIAAPKYVKMFEEQQNKEIASKKAFKIANSNEDVVILDLQSKESYEKKHIVNATNVTIDILEDYAAKNITDKKQPIICYCYCGGAGGSAKTAFAKLKELGYKKVYYTTPGDEWTYEGSEDINISNHKIVTGEEAKEIYQTNTGTILLDVRNQDEYDEKHIEGSILIPVNELESRLEEIPDVNSNIIVYCKAGARSETAYGILQNAGYTNVYDMQKVDNWPLD